MSKAFNIVDNINREDVKHEHPDIPFIVSNVCRNKFLVFFDCDNKKYRYVRLDEGETDGEDYNTLDELFEDNPDDIILETELVVKGLYK